MQKSRDFSNFFSLLGKTNSSALWFWYVSQWVQCFFNNINISSNLHGCSAARIHLLFLNYWTWIGKVCPLQRNVSPCLLAPRSRLNVPNEGVPRMRGLNWRFRWVPSEGRRYSFPVLGQGEGARGHEGWGLVPWVLLQHYCPLSTFSTLLSERFTLSKLASFNWCLLTLGVRT